MGCGEFHTVCCGFIALGVQGARDQSLSDFCIECGGSLNIAALYEFRRMDFSLMGWNGAFVY